MKKKRINIKMKQQEFSKDPEIMDARFMLLQLKLLQKHFYQDFLKMKNN